MASRYRKVAKTKNILYWKAPKPLNLRTIKFAEEGYFKGNKYFRPELVRAHDGVLGDPAPYNVGNDNVVAGTLIVCFALAMIASSMSRNFIARQIKNLFIVLLVVQISLKPDTKYAFKHS